MGPVLSCCNRGSSEEEEALLRARQAGYGSESAENEEDPHMAEQLRLQEEERIAQARENQLREIVNNTNDKMIDISMLTNSGIVIQGTDLIDNSTHFPEDRSDTEDGTDNYLAPVSSNLVAIMSNNASIKNNNNTTQNSTHSKLIDDQIQDSISHSEHLPVSKANFVQLDTNTQLSEQEKKQLKEMHHKIAKGLEEQLTVKPKGDLVITF